MSKRTTEPQNPYDVTGPWDLEGPAAYFINRHGQVIASVYAPDGDDATAYRRAQVMAHALWEGEEDE